MLWLDWLRSALGLEREGGFPTLLRVRAPNGAPAELVELSGTFAPGGERLSKTLVTAGGLCRLEWPLHAETLQVHVGTGDGSAEIEVASRRPDPDRVIEVRLEESFARQRNG